MSSLNSQSQFYQMTTYYGRAEMTFHKNKKLSFKY
jgi:hypothetical protein